MLLFKNKTKIEIIKKKQKKTNSFIYHLFSCLFTFLH